MKIVTEHEVEGCWSNPVERQKLGQELARCRNCGAVLEVAPKEDHYNSKYWYLKRNDGLSLVCCPEGCSTKDADKKMSEYMSISNFCTPESQTYKWEIDFSSFRNAWIDRNGRCYPVGDEQHTYFAEKVLRSSERELEDRGWAKISTVDWHAICTHERGFSIRQLDTILDFCFAHNLKTVGLYDLDQYGIYRFENEVKEDL